MSPSAVKLNASIRASVARALVETGVFDTGNIAPETLAVAESEGLLPLLDWALRQDPDYMGLPQSFRESLAARARGYAVAALWRDDVLVQVSKAISDAGLRSLLLKGPAFSRWLYSHSHLRVSGDFDLLFASRNDADRAAQAVEPLGYVLVFSPGSMTYEMTCRYAGKGVARPELDLHCRLINAPAYSEKFQFDELWEESIALRGLGSAMRGLGQDHALMHACMHRTVDMYLRRPDRLKWIYDIHLMAEAMDVEAWARFVQSAQPKGLCGVCLRSLEDSIEWFDTAVPPELVARMRNIAEAEVLDYRRLHDWGYMQWQSVRALPGVRARLRWLWQRLIPTQSHLQATHGDGSSASLLLKRLERGWLRIRGRG